MRSSKSGLGLVEILIVLVLVLGLAMFMLKKRGGETAKIQQTLQHQGINVSPDDVSTGHLEKAVESHVNKITDDHEKAIDCATGDSCTANQPPAPAASASQSQ